NGESIWVTENNGATKIRKCHFCNDDDIVTSAPNALIRVETGSTSILIEECRFEPKICTNLVRVDGADHFMALKNHMELPATATCTRFFNIGNGTTSAVKSGVIAKNFANSKGNADEFAAITGSDGLSIHD